MLESDVTIGMTLTGALTPAGLGMAALIPLIEAGFVDWIISTGANLYHDAHFGLGLSMHRGNPLASDTVLREEGIDRKSTRLNSSHANISYAVFCLKKKK